MGMKVKAVEKVADREIDISEMQAKIRLFVSHLRDFHYLCRQK